VRSASLRRRVAAVPPWAWLAALVVVSTVVRYGFARRNVAPWIMIDEIVYSELAKSFGAGHGFEVRGVPTTGYGIVYPILISPAYALFDALPTAYAAVKAINSLAISLAAVPAYLLARRVVSPRGALVVALLTVAVPSTMYAGVVMTENAFYALFLVAALALVAALERPTALRAALFVGALGLAYLTRAQAIALAPAALTAPLFLGPRPRQLLRFRRLYGLVLGLGALAVVAEVARGRPLRSLVGAYAAATDSSYSASDVARWLLWHLAELDLYVGVVPVVALVVLVSILPRLEGAERALVAATIALVGWFALEVAAFASQPSVQRIEERNLFYVAPLLFTVLVLWVERGLPRPRVTTLAAAAGAAALAATVPYERFIGVQSTADTLMTLPLWSLSNWLTIPLESIRWVVGGVAAVLAAAAVAVPRRAGFVLPFLVFALYLAVLQPIERRMHTAAIGALFQGITNPDRDWIDTAVGRDARVGVLWSGLIDRFVVNQNEFFNRSVQDVLYNRDPVPGNLPQTKVDVDPRTGLLRDPDGHAIRLPYLLSDRTLPLAGRAVAHDTTKGTEVLRLDGPLRVRYLVGGVEDDGWARRAFSYRGFGCRPGASVDVRLGSDPKLFKRAQVVRAYVGGRLAGTARVPPGGERTLSVRGCNVVYRVARTAVPARVEPDSTDTRPLGIRVLGFG
jgi:hypothetical protein